MIQFCFDSTSGISWQSSATLLTMFPSQSEPINLDESTLRVEVVARGILGSKSLRKGDEEGASS
jgi:hypothetical protein